MASFFKILFFLAMCQIAFHANAQEYAMDFIQTDCNGQEHHLFSELDEGRVIIHDLVMIGCAPCIWATKDLDTIVNAYAVTHPGRVEIYAFSYDSLFSCEQMMDWRAAGGFPNVSVFTHGNDLVSYYGGIGMPTIVVTGSSLHKVFYNGFGYSAADDSLIVAAIDNALNYDQSGVEDEMAKTGFRVYPTVFTDRIYVEINEDLPGAEVMIYDSCGRLVLSSAIDAESLQSINTAFLPKGFYITLLKTGNSLYAGFRLIKI